MYPPIIGHVFERGCYVHGGRGRQIKGMAEQYTVSLLTLDNSTDNYECCTLAAKFVSFTTDSSSKLNYRLHYYFWPKTIVWL